MNRCIMRTANSEQRTANSEQRTANSDLLPAFRDYLRLPQKLELYHEKNFLTSIALAFLFSFLIFSSAHGAAVGAPGVGVRAPSGGQGSQIDEQTLQGLNENEINKYFNEIFDSGKLDRSTVTSLFRRLPRYGMSLFRQPSSTSAPQQTLQVARDYRINVGDEMTLSIRGIPREVNYSFVVRRDGTARIPRSGTIRLVGYTFEEVERLLERQLSKYYVGYQMHLSMGRPVYFTGEAHTPGAYAISSFSTFIDVLQMSGGPNANGTLRRIELKRGRKTIANFDTYAVLMPGNKPQDIRLQPGDVIDIPQVGELIGIAGEIRNPGVYELNDETRLEDLIYIACGLNARTFAGRIQYFKATDNTYANAVEGTLADFQHTELHDGDILRLYPLSNYSASISITGPLVKPGTYAITPGHTRIDEIIQRGGGLLSTASNRAIVTRVTPSLKGPVNERLNVDLERAMEGDPEDNMTLEANDKITIMTRSW